MNRRQLMALLGGGATLLPIATRAQGTTPARLGYLWIGARGTDPSNLPGLSQGLADKGYVVGKTILIEERYADGHDERVPDLVAELLALKVDVLLTPGTPISLAAKHATSTVPIVSLTGDPVGAGLAASLSRPGGNVTGIAVQSWTYSSKWLGLLKETVPKMRVVAALWSQGNPGTAPEMAQLRQSAGELGLEMVELSTRREDAEASLSKISAGGLDALVVTDDPVNETLLPRLISLAAASHMPALYGFNTAVRQGGLISYSVDRFELWRRQAAGYIDRILKGARPAELPIEQATTITLGVNLATAKQLGLTIPASILARADEVVE
jgi:putative tryptophan/tyrosine transport system substrate-binding protein